MRKALSMDVVMTYAYPTLPERLSCGAAAVAHYARYAQAVEAGDGMSHVVMPMCLCCGEGTGNWCDECDYAGVHWLMPGTTTDLMQGSPLCSACDNRDPHPCPVCSGHVAPYVVAAEAELPSEAPLVDVDGEILDLTLADFEELYAQMGPL